MNVLQINQSDISGGAAIAAYNLHQELISQGHSSNLLTDTNRIDSDFITTVDRRRYIESLSSRLAYHLGLNYINLTSTFKLSEHPFYQKADVLNLHSIHGGYFNYLALPKLTRNKPAVFTLHDMWALTGHCSYSFDCDRWESGCGNCPSLSTYPAVARDSTSTEWKLKRWAYNHSNISIVTPSKWLAQLAKQSILNIFPIEVIPNGINTELYKPLDKKTCREALNVPSDKTVLLFAAQSLKDKRKGGDLLLNILKKVNQKVAEGLTLLVLGEHNESLIRDLNIPTVALGYIGGDRIKALAYSAADLFIFPTRADNLPLVIQESMACGTPTVSFDVGGVPELVRPGITGLLAKAEDTTDLSEKIVTLIENEHLRQQMAENCRVIAEAEYSINLQATRYSELYYQIVHNTDKHKQKIL